LLPAPNPDAASFRKRSDRCPVGDRRTRAASPRATNVCFPIASMIHWQGRERRLWVDSSGSVRVAGMAGIGATSPLTPVSTEGRIPPDSAVRPGRPERRVCARLQPFTAEVDPTRLSLLTVANAEICMADEIDRTLARPRGAARVLSATGGEGRQIRPQTHRRGALPTVGHVDGDAGEPFRLPVPLGAARQSGCEGLSIQIAALQLGTSATPTGGRAL
jgi:hypothetical protein